MILCALDRRQAVLLTTVYPSDGPSAFIMITKSGEIIGKGFQFGDEWTAFPLLDLLQMSAVLRFPALFGG